VSKAQLDRGYKLTELLKQGLHSPMPVEEQVVSLYAGTKGFLDDVDIDDVGRFERELLEEFRSRYSDLMGEIRSSGKLPDEGKLKGAIDAFKERFQPGSAKDDSAASKSDASKSGADKSGADKSDDGGTAGGGTAGGGSSGSGSGDAGSGSGDATTEQPAGSPAAATQAG
jgi:F-type H+-transporting ATPase subunit alpha